jgi:hypothetical protein
MTYLTDVLDRAVAIEKEAMSTLSKTVDAVPYFFHVQEAFPYFTNRVQGLPIDHADNNEYEQFPLPRVIARCVIGHITAGYKGDPDDVIYTYIPLLTSYFAKRKWFQSAAYPTRPDFLIYSEVVDAGGFQTFNNAGFANVIQVGFELTIACRFTEYIDQVYL